MWSKIPGFTEDYKYEEYDDKEASYFIDRSCTQVYNQFSDIAVIITRD